MNDVQSEYDDGMRRRSMNRPPVPDPDLEISRRPSIVPQIPPAQWRKLGTGEDGATLYSAPVGTPPPWEGLGPVGTEHGRGALFPFVFRAVQDMARRAYTEHGPDGLLSDPDEFTRGKARVLHVQHENVQRSAYTSVSDPGTLQTDLFRLAYSALAWAQSLGMMSDTSQDDLTDRH
jgi:hypothetical protein